MKHLSKSSEDTLKVARDFLATIKPQERATVVALQGDLGAGKTNFAQVAGEILGVRENMHSPTFVIMKIYDLKPTTHNPQPTANPHAASGRSSIVGRWSKLIHIDAYRLEKEEELLHLGWEKIVSEPENLVLIEWPENVTNLIPDTARKISFKFIDEATREISYDN